MICGATRLRVTITNVEICEARTAYREARGAAAAAGCDDLAVDALHMMAFVDTNPDDQLRWNREALTLALSSSQKICAFAQLTLRRAMQTKPAIASPSLAACAVASARVADCPFASSA